VILKVGIASGIKQQKGFTNVGENCPSFGHIVSARQAYLRASNYYRTAEFFLHENPDDSRIVETWEQSISSFNKAARLFPHIWQIKGYLIGLMTRVARIKGAIS
jgi:hypothetical protein